MSADISKPLDVCDQWQAKGDKLMNAGKYSDATQAFATASTIAERSQAGAQKLIEIYTSLASAYALAGRFADSNYEFHRALDLIAKTQGRNSLKYAVLLANTSLLPTESGSKTEAIELLRHAIALSPQTDFSRSRFMACDLLIVMLLSEKRYKEADLVLADLQPSFTRLKAGDPDSAAELLNDLAVVRHSQHRFEEAVMADIESIRLLKVAWGNQHPMLVVPLNNLAILYADLNRFDEAALTFQESVNLCAETLGENHPTYGGVLINYASLLKKMGHKGEGKKMEARAERILQDSNRYNGISSTVSIAAIRGGRN